MKEPNWLTDEVKEKFDYEIFTKNGFQVTRLRRKVRGYKDG